MSEIVSSYTLARVILKNQFFRAFHSTDPGAEIKAFLEQNFSGNCSHHLDALYHFCKIVEADPDAPGMVWGMIWDAWSKFMEEDWRS